MPDSFFTADHDAYRESVREFLKRDVIPHYDTWEDERLVDRAAWQAAGANGIIGLAIPEEYAGGGEPDYRYRVVVGEETAKVAVTSFGTGIAVQDDPVLPYLIDLATDEQKQRWLPALASGELIGATAMTEPSAGSDLQGIRTTAAKVDDGWVLNGQKTFISKILADLVIVVARTSEQRVLGRSASSWSNETSPDSSGAASWTSSDWPARTRLNCSSIRSMSQHRTSWARSGRASST
jgi:alkylation response protein AidB-like acyl-CoA dehydrogenase